MKSEIAAAARAAGFDDVGFATAGMLDADLGRLRAWLEQGRHGEMGWMAREPEKRASTSEWVRSVIVFSKAYPPLEFPPGVKKYAAYAEGKDYHQDLKARLLQVAEVIRRHGGRAQRFADTGAVLERAWAQKAGLGFIGRNTLLLSRTHGPYVLLSVIFTDLEIAPDAPGVGSCGECTRCIEMCPTHALDADGLDARKCISYLTIELGRPMTRAEASMTGEWEFGCDTCIMVCPYASYAPPPVKAVQRGVER